MPVRIWRQALFLAKRDQLSMEKQDNGFLPINFASYQVDDN